MADIHTFVPRTPRARPPGAELGLGDEAIRRGVQYLAFRPGPSGLKAGYAPGPGHVNGYVARAARAAVGADEDLARNPPLDFAVQTGSAALALRRRFADQLAEVKAGPARTPANALRSAYLDALADFMIETVRREGLTALQAWAAHGG